MSFNSGRESLSWRWSLRSRSAFQYCIRSRRSFFGVGMVRADFRSVQQACFKKEFGQRDRISCMEEEREVLLGFD